MLRHLLIFAIILVSYQILAEYQEETGDFVKEDCVKGWEQQPVVCRARKRIFHWDDSKKECLKQFYSGCHKTRNNFVTLEECKKIAEPICKA
ncbi:unnamed protein product [Brassicogethes aeneus]|uniref:BPTI/Kunitz inhibitor domain-containing protein n=1 Tax=Brassicogethes aeneus TaxID=1431903 RepID=A0A9P0BFN8_BRAAE|nr:unnamed protein product [Brassicogethes aeneus]